MNALESDIAAGTGVVRSAAAGDEVAFAGLVATHHEAMARVAFVICGEADATRDIMQNAWTKAWRRLPSLRDPTQVRAWLIAIAANEARQAMRRRRRQPVVDISAVVARSAGTEAASTAEIADLHRVLASLSADDRRLLAMRYAADLDSAQIATHVGISASGVRSRLARLLDRLRNDLALEEPEAVP